MATQQRLVPKTKPITANPLFPAVVALWFGALFGLSSLAVRVSVIEALVMKSGIDLIVPAAAPPLGITARILMALLLAALGALIGAMIARRLARPSAQVRERKRSPQAQDTAQQPVRARDSHPDAPARRPISAHEELGEESPVSVPAMPGLLAGRRRALTVEAEQSHFVPPEFAPLPGGEPQILDLAGAEIEPAKIESVVTAAAVPVLAPFVPEYTAAPVAEHTSDLNAYSDSSVSDVEHDAPAAQVITPQPQAVAAPEAGMQEDAAGDHGLAGRQVFGMAPVEPQDPASRQIFGEPAAEEEPASDLVRNLGIQASVFDAPTADPLFAKRAEPAPDVPAAPDAAPSIFAAAPEVPAPAPAEALPPVADLDMTALALRLQESMKRRRAARAVPQVEAASAFAPQQALPRLSPDVEPTPFAAPAPSRPLAVLPAAMRPLSFDDFDDDNDDGEALASLVPPRHIALPEVEATAIEAGPVAQALSDDMAPIDDEAEEAAPDDEAAYASLLGVNAPVVRPSFVRIEEPEAISDQYEPVVIFPGQIPSALSEVAPVASPVAEEQSGFRRFDAPDSAGQGQPIAGNTAAPTLDAEEAERSLRAALANLQRISGAA